MDTSPGNAFTGTAMAAAGISNTVRRKQDLAVRQLERIRKQQLCISNISYPTYSYSWRTAVAGVHHRAHNMKMRRRKDSVNTQDYVQHFRRSAAGAAARIVVREKVGPIHDVLIFLRKSRMSP